MTKESVNAFVALVNLLWFRDFLFGYDAKIGDQDDSAMKEAFPEEYSKICVMRTQDKGAIWTLFEADQYPSCD
jgi:hypothetical protein